MWIFTLKGISNLRFGPTSKLRTDNNIIKMKNKFYDNNIINVKIADVIYIIRRNIENKLINK